jgi:hypothetical protein
LWWWWSHISWPSVVFPKGADSTAIFLLFCNANILGSLPKLAHKYVAFPRRSVFAMVISECARCLPLQNELVVKGRDMRYIPALFVRFQASS